MQLKNNSTKKLAGKIEGKITENRAKFKKCKIWNKITIFVSGNALFNFVHYQKHWCLSHLNSCSRRCMHTKTGAQAHLPLLNLFFLQLSMSISLWFQSPQVCVSCFLSVSPTDHVGSTGRDFSQMNIHKDATRCSH